MAGVAPWSHSCPRRARTWLCVLCRAHVNAGDGEEISGGCGYPIMSCHPHVLESHLPELPLGESMGKLPSCGVALFWHLVLSVSLFSWWFPEM